MKLGVSAAYDVPAEYIDRHPDDTRTRHTCLCGDDLEARPAAWSSTLDVVCPSCNRGGHIDQHGTKHGPAFVNLGGPSE